MSISSRASSALDHEDISLNTARSTLTNVGNNENDTKNTPIGDDELLRLSKYFEQSRIDLQKKVDSILLMNPPENGNSSSDSNDLDDDGESNGTQRNNILGPTKEDKGPAGKPITLAIATELRQLTVGNCVHRLSDEWRRAKVTYRPEDSDMPYGLYSEKNGSKGLILCIQAHLLRNLMIKSYTDITGQEITNSAWRNKRRMLRPNANERRDALIKSLADILWNAGEKTSASITLNSFKNSFDIKINPKIKTNYHADGITEKLAIYEFEQYKQLEDFIRKNLATFQRDDGLVLFLYSLILSRKLARIKHDLQGASLIGDMEDCKIALFNLVLSGVAVPYLHNNTVFYDKHGKELEKPLVGLKARSEIGILYWNHDEEASDRTEVGSMLKTPKYPIWILLMKNFVAIMFNTNLDLLNDWRFEQVFNLYFYTGLRKQENEVKFTIDTRNVVEDTPEMQLSKKFSHLMKKEEDKDADIVEIIYTKWPNCEIRDIDPKELMSLL